MYRKPHYIEIGTFQSGNPDKTDPFLHTVGTGLVHRTVFLYIIRDLFLRQLVESHIRHCGETFLESGRSYTDTGYHLMCTPRQATQHPAGIRFILRLTQYLTVYIDNRVGRNNQFVIFHPRTVSICLFTGNVFGYLLPFQRIGISLVNTRQNLHFVINSQP